MRSRAAWRHRIVASEPSRHWCVTSKPTMVTSAPEWNTRSAASGSWMIFVSAVVSQQLPSCVSVPPIITNRNLLAISGAAVSAASTSVSGPVATTVTSLPYLRTISTMNRTPSGNAGEWAVPSQVVNESENESAAGFACGSCTSYPPTEISPRLTRVSDSPESDT